VIKRIAVIFLYGIIFYLILLIPSFIIGGVIYTVILGYDMWANPKLSALIVYGFNLVFTIGMVRLYLGKANKEKLINRRKANLRCTKCSQVNEVIYKVTFDGFRVFQCPICKRDVTYPLRRVYRFIYLFIVIVWLAGTVYSIIFVNETGKIIFNIIIAVGFAFLLYRDHLIRVTLKSMEIKSNGETGEKKEPGST